jgi:hypothetical protein
MVLCHVVCAGLQGAMRASSESSQETSTRLASRRSFRSLGLPSSNDILGDWEKMVRRDEGGRGHGGVLVDYARLDETLDGLHGRGVDDAAEGADGVGAVYDVAADGCVLHYGGGDHDDIVGGASELLDDQVDHLAERGILVLEQLRYAKEEGCGFLASPALSGEEQQGQLGQDHSTFPGRYRALVEYSCWTRSAFPPPAYGLSDSRPTFLEHGRLVNLGDSASILVLLVHGVVVQLRTASSLRRCVNLSRSSSA